MNNNNSVETILQFQQRNDDNYSDWSTVWSTSHVPGMDTATGAGSSRRRKTGRRRLRITSLSFCSMLTMHVHVISAAIAGSFFIFMLLLIPAVAILANPLRHFEVYLGQWSISGPGRAFRIIPMFDGIGLAICIHALIRAVINAVIAGITVIYVMHSVSDKTLPFTYCRDMNLTLYEPEVKYVDSLLFMEKELTLESLMDTEGMLQTSTVGTDELGWRKAHFNNNYKQLDGLQRSGVKRTAYICKEKYSSGYPIIYKTPPYNYFYVEVMHYREDHSFLEFNIPLLISTMVVWVTIWVVLMTEKCSHGRVIWNNMYPWFCCVPWLWSGLLLFTGITIFLSTKKNWRNSFQIGGNREILGGVTDALVVAAYVHAAGLGTEIVHGKGLNHYASGHIDQLLNGENLWHSGILLLLTGISSAGADICALNDYMQMRGVNKIGESSMWVLPMYSKCTAMSGKYSHLVSTLIFSGLTFSYTTVAFVCLKTALHIIFEYRVKLVFIEQIVVGLTIVVCAAFSALFATNGGLALLEALDAMTAGIMMPLICTLESFGLMYVYQSHDFVSDMNIATEENACSTRLGIQWQVMPFICTIMLINKIVLLASAEIPSSSLWYSVVPLACAVLAVPLRAIYNAYHFMHPPKRS